jgi:hypothetical protein
VSLGFDPVRQWWCSFLRENPNELGQKVEGFPSTAATRAAISMHGSRTEAETAAFGYPARALVFKQRVRKSTFGYPRHAPS